MDCAKTMNFPSTSLSGLHLLKDWQSHWHSSGLPGPPSYIIAVDLSTHLSWLMPSLCSCCLFLPTSLQYKSFQSCTQSAQVLLSQTNICGDHGITQADRSLQGDHHKGYSSSPNLNKNTNNEKKSQKQETFLNMNYIPKCAHNKCHHLLYLKSRPIFI